MVPHVASSAARYELVCCPPSTGRARCSKIYEDNWLPDLHDHAVIRGKAMRLIETWTLQRRSATVTLREGVELNGVLICYVGAELAKDEHLVSRCVTT